MSDLRNLIYNADGIKSTDGWTSGTTINAGGVITKSGNLDNSELIPINPTDTYRLTFDIKITTNDGSNGIYVALQPCDSSKAVIGSSYYYPWSSTNANLPSDWKSVSVDFTRSSINANAIFAKFVVLGYSHTYSIRNLRLENITSRQIQILNSNTTVAYNKTGNMVCAEASNCGMNVRYIKDQISGSSTNSNNHWVELQALDPNGINLALGKPCTINGTAVIDPKSTNGDIETANYDRTEASTGSLVVDLGFVTKISKIKVWHYYGDGRTYIDHKVYVSTDGTNWELVHIGDHKETADGLTVTLYPDRTSIYKTGLLEFTDITEY